MKARQSYFLILTLLVAPLAKGDAVSDLVVKAEAGDGVAQMELAGLYSKGEGVKPDVAEAVKWFSKAAEQGSGEAQMKLGAIFIAGKGVRKNSTEAAKWFMMSALSGNSTAQCQIGRMHMMGAGVPKDDVEAYKWANLAAAQGDSAAKQVLVFLEEKMKPEQVAEGQKRSREFLEMKKAEETLKLPPDPPAETLEVIPPTEPE